MNSPLNESERGHISVLLEEAVGLLSVQPEKTYLDATLGLGGHAEAVLATPATTLIGIDQDADAVKLAAERLIKFGKRAIIVRANFSDLKDVLASVNIEKIDGVLADLGASSMQLDSVERGFSFRSDAFLDMRMDRSRGETAAELLERSTEEQIADVIYRFGEERHSRRIARRIVERRKAGQPVTTTKELAELAERAVGRSPKDKIHPATRTFQALRIAVNHEIDILEDFIEEAVNALKVEGRIVIISFHSLEDRIVKQTFQKLSGRCQCPPRIPQCVCRAEKKIEILTRKPITASAAEIDKNPRARSAKLRAARRFS